MKICKNCRFKYQCDDPDNEYTCPAARELIDIYKNNKRRLKIERLKSLKKLLSFYDAEIDRDIKKIAENIIKRESELDIIEKFDIKIGYVRSFKTKSKDNKPVYATCTKVNDMYSAYIPFDFIITVYDRNVCYLTDDQIEILIFHELLHIDCNNRGLCIKPHDIEDFDTIVNKYGLHWDNEA